VFIFSPIPPKPISGDGSTTRFDITPGCFLEFKHPGDSKGASIRDVAGSKEDAGQRFAKFTLTPADGYARLTCDLPNFFDLTRVEGPHVDLELQLVVFCLASATLAVDFISILHSPPGLNYYTPLAVFGRSLQFSSSSKQILALTARIEKQALMQDHSYRLVLQVPSGDSTFFISPLALGMAKAPTRRRPASAIRTFDVNGDLPFHLGGSAELVRINAGAETDAASKSNKVTVRVPKGETGYLELPLDPLDIGGLASPLDVSATLTPENGAFSVEALCDRGVLMGTSVPFLISEDKAAGPLRTSRAYRTVVPRDDGLARKKLVLGIDALNETAVVEIALDVARATTTSQFEISRHLVPVIATTAPKAKLSVPSLFDADHAAASLRRRGAIGEIPSPSGRGQIQSLWDLAEALAPDDLDPHPLFSTSWYVAQCRLKGRPVPESPAAAFTTYLAGAHDLDPHPLIDEAFVRAQVRALGDTQTGSALAVLSTKRDYRICPNRLFDTGRVATALGTEKNSTTVADVVLAYISDSSAWGHPTSVLFDPSCLPDQAEAPLLAYLRDHSNWYVSPTPLFDPSFFVQQDGVPAGLPVAPLAYYLAVETTDFISAGPVFATRYVAMQNIDTWRGVVSPLEHFTTTLQGRPHPRFDRKAYFEAAPSEKVFGLDLDDIVAAGNRYDAPRNALRKTLSGTVVQMTPKRPRNPYYRQMPDAFLAAGRDFRFSNNPDEMIDFAKSRPDLILWWHQLEPFYHDPDSATATKDRSARLIKQLRHLRDAGVRLVHTWHNALPYDGKYRDIDYAMMFEVADLFDLILVHARSGVDWIRKFTAQTPVHVVPHPSLLMHFNTTIDKRVAREILGLDPDLFLVHSFGEMKAYKRIDLVIDAWQALNAAGETGDMALALTGRWANRDATYHRANTLTDAIVLDELMSDNRLELWISAADVCVFSHPRVWASGAMMTAISMGKPVIVPDGTGLIEVVQDGQNGFVFKNGDVASLSDAILRARDFPYPDHAEFLNRSLAEELHPFRLQPQISHLFEAL
jgi:beta-1,4-mannosyltransferase